MLVRLTAALLLLATPVLAQSVVRATPPDGYKFLSAAEIDSAVSRPEAGRDGD